MAATRKLKSDGKASGPRAGRAIFPSNTLQSTLSLSFSLSTLLPTMTNMNGLEIGTLITATIEYRPVQTSEREGKAERERERERS